MKSRSRFIFATDRCSYVEKKKESSTRIGEFSSDDHYVYYCGEESLRRNGIALIVHKTPKCSTWVQSQKRQNDFGSFPRQTIQYHTNPNLCPHHWCQRSWSWLVLWRPTTPSRTNIKTKQSFLIIRNWNRKLWSQEIPGITGKLDLGVHKCFVSFPKRFQLRFTFGYFLYLV